MYNSDEISWKDHKNWFEKLGSNPDSMNIVVSDMELFLIRI